MSKTRVLWLAMCAVVAVVTAGPSAMAAQTPIKLIETDPASGGFGRDKGTVGIAGKIFEGYMCNRGFATWRVPGGYAAFEGYCGTDDSAGREAKGTIEFLLDGDTVKTVDVSAGQKAVKVSIPVRGGQSLRINISEYNCVLAEPRFLASPTGSAPATTPYSPLSPPPSVATAAFAIDSNGLDRLADSLRKQCEAKPALKSKIESGQVAIARFNLIGISAKSVADNVVENLYTAMIKGGFSLIERGQLDKVLDELKVQDSGAVDPATAQKIGKLSGCDIILLGSVSDQGLIVINARMMDTATGKSLAAERVELQKIPIK